MGAPVDSKGGCAFRLHPNPPPVGEGVKQTPPPVGEGVKQAPPPAGEGVRSAYLFPLQRSVPTFVSLLSTPFIGLSVIRATPVSV